MTTPGSLLADLEVDLDRQQGDAPSQLVDVLRQRVTEARQHSLDAASRNATPSRARSFVVEQRRVGFDAVRGVVFTERVLVAQRVLRAITLCFELRRIGVRRLRRKRSRRNEDKSA